MALFIAIVVVILDLWCFNERRVKKMREVYPYYLKVDGAKNKIAAEKAKKEDKS